MKTARIVSMILLGVLVLNTVAFSANVQDVFVQENTEIDCIAFSQTDQEIIGHTASAFSEAFDETIDVTDNDEDSSETDDSSGSQKYPSVGSFF